MYFPSEEDFNKLSELLWKDYDELEESINTDLSGEFMKDYNKARIKYYEEFPNAKTPFDDALKLFQASEKGNKNSLLWPLYSEEAWQELLDFIRDYN